MPSFPWVLWSAAASQHPIAEGGNTSSALHTRCDLKAEISIEDTAEKRILYPASPGRSWPCIWWLPGSCNVLQPPNATYGRRWSGEVWKGMLPVFYLFYLTKCLKIAQIMMWESPNFSDLVNLLIQQINEAKLPQTIFPLINCPPSWFLGSQGQY